MTKTTSICYCDILSEHGNNLVENASHYKNVFAMVPVQGEGDAEEPVIISSIDMCPSCYAKYKSTLRMTYNAKRQPVYSFDDGTVSETINGVEEPAGS